MSASMIITEALPHLPADIVHHMLSTFVASLPPPLADTPQGLIARDEAAIAAVVSLRPTDAFQLSLATLIVAVHGHGMYCLHLAARPGVLVDYALRYRTQAATMARESQRALRDLVDLQIARENKTEAARPVVAKGRAVASPDDGVDASGAAGLAKVRLVH
jgi:hypothetical protein